MNTPEQEARDMLERMEVEGAQSFSAGDLVELANLKETIDFSIGVDPRDVFHGIVNQEPAIDSALETAKRLGIE